MHGAVPLFSQCFHCMALNEAERKLQFTIVLSHDWNSIMSTKLTDECVRQTVHFETM